MNLFDHSEHSTTHSILSGMENTLYEGDIEDIKMLIKSFAEQKLNITDFNDYIQRNERHINNIDNKIQKVFELNEYIEILKSRIETLETQLKNVLLQNEALLNNTK